MHGVTKSNVHFSATPCVAEKFGPRVPIIAETLFRTLIKNRMPLEIAFLQFTVDGQLCNFATTITKRGFTVIELDLGEKRYPGLLVTQIRFHQELAKALYARNREVAKEAAKQKADREAQQKGRVATNGNEPSGKKAAQAA